MAGKLEVAEGPAMGAEPSPQDDAAKERFKALLAHIDSRKLDRRYFAILDEEVALYRVQIQEQVERELAEEGK